MLALNQDGDSDSDEDGYLDRLPGLKKRMGALEDEEVDSGDSEDDGKFKSYQGTANHAL